MKDVANDLSSPLFETKLSWSDQFFAYIQLVGGLGMAVYFLSKLNKTDWGAPLFLAVFFIVFAFRGIQAPVSFHLLSDRLVVRGPFAFSALFATQFKLTELREVIFREVKGRFGGPHIIVRARTRIESYRTYLADETLDAFMAKLTEVGVKVSKDPLR